jgi:hypothetical protein
MIRVVSSRLVAGLLVSVLLVQSMLVFHSLQTSKNGNPKAEAAQEEQMKHLLSVMSNFVSLYNQTHTPLASLSSPSSPRNRNTHSIHYYNASWSYQVFYRGSKHLERTRGGSQSGQDVTVIDILNFKRGGFFVDLASNDAFSLSNTERLEFELGWSGLCIEPNPVYRESYLRGRRCALVSAAVGQKDDSEVIFHMKDWAGGIDGFDIKGVQANTVRLRTVSLETLFAAFNVPSVVDYFSLDIEGAEFYTMEQFPFHKYTFLVITVERPKQLRLLLEKNGYVYVKDHGDFGDELYVHRSIPGFHSIIKKHATKSKPLLVTLKCPHNEKACIESLKQNSSYKGQSGIEK